MTINYKRLEPQIGLLFQKIKVLKVVFKLLEPLAALFKRF